MIIPDEILVAIDQELTVLVSGTYKGFKEFNYHLYIHKKIDKDTIYVKYNFVFRSLIIKISC